MERQGKYLHYRMLPEKVHHMQLFFMINGEEI